MGLTGYYRKFVFQYASLAAPLTILVAKDNFLWIELAQNTFEKSKQVNDHITIISIPEIFRSFYSRDICVWGGNWIVLLQNNHPLAFLSKKLSPQMQKTSNYARSYMQ